jgi:hypothetical protein
MFPSSRKGGLLTRGTTRWVCADPYSSRTIVVPSKILWSLAEQMWVDFISIVRYGLFCYSFGPNRFVGAPGPSVWRLRFMSLGYFSSERYSNRFFKVYCQDHHWILKICMVVLGKSEPWKDFWALTSHTVGPDGACTSMCENGVQVKVFGPFVGEIFVEEMSNFVVHGQNSGGQYIRCHDIVWMVVCVYSWKWGWNMFELHRENVASIYQFRIRKYQILDLYIEYTTAVMTAVYTRVLD